MNKTSHDSCKKTIEGLVREVQNLQKQLDQKESDGKILQGIIASLKQELDLKNEQLDFIFGGYGNEYNNEIEEKEANDVDVKCKEESKVVAVNVSRVETPLKLRFSSHISKYVMLVILKFMDVESLFSISLVNRPMQCLTSFDKYWKKAYNAFYPRYIDVIDRTLPIRISGYSKYLNFDNDKKEMEEKKKRIDSQDNLGEKTIVISYKQKFLERFMYDRKWHRSRPVVTTLIGHNEPITCLKMDKSGQHFFSGSIDGSAILWEIRNHSAEGNAIYQQHHRQTQAAEKKVAFQGHSGPIWCLDVNDNHLFTGSYDKTIKLWDKNTGTCTDTLRGHTSWVNCIKYIQTHDRIISGAYNNIINLWNYQSGNILRSLDVQEYGGVFSLECTPHSNSVIVGTRSGSVCSYELATFNPLTVNKCHDSIVYCLKATKNVLISGSQDRTVCITDLNSGGLINKLKEHTSSVMTIDYDEDHYRLVSGSKDKQIKVWDLRRMGVPLQTLKGHSKGITALCVDYFKIISGSDDKTVKIWRFDNDSAGDCYCGATMCNTLLLNS